MNTTDFFAGCYDQAALKTRFRDLCKVHHPDLGGDLKTMQELNAAYERAMRGEYRKTMSDDDAEEAVSMDAELAAKVAEVIVLKGIILELVGRWLWATGETFAVKGELKAAGFFWAAKKCAWYYRKPEDGGARRSNLSLFEIKAKYGAKNVGGANARRTIAA